MHRPHSGCPRSHFTLDAPHESQLDLNRGGLDLRVVSPLNGILCCMLKLPIFLDDSGSGCFYVQVLVVYAARSRMAREDGTIRNVLATTPWSPRVYMHI